jgi:hypothetical protein
MFDLAVAVYDTGLVPFRYVRQQFGAAAARAIRARDYGRFVRCLSVRHVRGYLFGLVPFLKISRADTQTRTFFIGVPLIRISKRPGRVMVYLFHIIPVLKLRGQ